MAWIESHQSLGTHLKTKRLARALGIHPAQAIGHLHFLWWWALDHAPEGDLSDLSPEDIAEVCEWPGEVGRLFAALQDCGWVDAATGRIHAWDDYAGRLIEKRSADRERKRTARKPNETACPADIQRTSSGHPADGARTAHVPTNPTNQQTDRPETTPCEPLGAVPTSASAAQRKPASAEQCVEVGKMLGMPEADSRQWFAEMEVCQWSKIDGTPFGNWRREMSVHRDRMRERDFRRPKQLPTDPNAPTQPNGAQIINWSKELDAAEAKITKIRGQYEGLQDWTDSDKAEVKRLKTRVAELKKNLGREV